MSAEGRFHGSLFTNDFLQSSIAKLPDWSALSNSQIDDFAADLHTIFDRFPIDQTPNESQTENDLIWPILETLGWTASLRQLNLTSRGRNDVPDGLLFADDESKHRANRGFHPPLCGMRKS